MIARAVGRAGGALVAKVMFEAAGRDEGAATLGLAMVSIGVRRLLSRVGSVAGLAVNFRLLAARRIIGVVSCERVIYAGCSLGHI
jgi:hypothetical protein